MDTQKVETRLLSDDQLDAVSGGAPLTEAQEEVRQTEAIKAMHDALQELP